MKTLYVVQEGDWLAKIASKQLGDQKRWAEIAYINGIEYPHIIVPGQVLELPNADDEGIEIVITKGQDEKQPAQTETVNVGLLVGLAIGAYFLLR